MKILLVGPSWVGDMVMTQSLCAVLHDRNPELVLDVLAPEWTRPLLERMPGVNQAISMPVGHGSLQWGLRRKLGRQLKIGGYDQAIVLPNSFKSALVPWFAGIPLRTGWRGEMRYGLLNDSRVLDKVALPLMVQRFVALAFPKQMKKELSYPDPVLSADTSSLSGLRERLGLVSDRPVVVFCPGAEYGPSKQWPAGYFAKLAIDCVSQGKQVWITGSARDRAVAEEICQGADQYLHVHNLAGLTTLGEVIDLISVAEKVVTNDSGLMHVAAALQRPLVAIYGSTSSAFTPPLGKSVRMLSAALECSPCFSRECPLKHHDCMNRITPGMVSTALNGLPAPPVIASQQDQAGTT